MSRRDDVMLHQEGALLTFAATYDLDTAAEQCRGVIDGAFNAMLRFETPEEVAKFAFAVADRVAGKVKASTAYPPPAAPAVVVALPPPAPAKEEPRRYGFWRAFATGWAVGVMTVLGLSDPATHFFGWVFR